MFLTGITDFKTRKLLNFVPKKLLLRIKPEKKILICHVLNPFKNLGNFPFFVLVHLESPPYFQCSRPCFPNNCLFDLATAPLISRRKNEEIINFAVFHRPNCLGNITWVVSLKPFDPCESLSERIKSCKIQISKREVTFENLLACMFSAHFGKLTLYSESESTLTIAIHCLICHRGPFSYILTRMHNSSFSILPGFSLLD